ncbi:hypothetical protein [Streptomyces thermoalcalitolerans]|uniref:Secreted protein n=1 Tax=Streptomyces thermoalcalitolerans TaxID=65605 RepID=A0ABN1ND63_9ACTN
MPHAPRTAPGHPLAFLSAVLLTFFAFFTGGSSPYPTAAASAPHGDTKDPSAHAGRPLAAPPVPRPQRLPGPADDDADRDPPDGAPRSADRSGDRSDEQYRTVCSTQSGTRQEAHGERPPPHTQSATAAREAAPAAPPGRRVAAVSGYVPCPVGHVLRVGGRAPPGGPGV